MGFIRDIILYVVSILLGIMTVGGFMTNVPTGVLLLVATLVCMPATHGLLSKLTGHKISKGVIALIGFLLALALTFAGEMLAIQGEEESVVEDSQVTEQTGVPLSEAENNVVGTDVIQDSVVDEEQPENEDADKTDDDSDTEPTDTNDASTPSRMEVHFIDIGQGDATLIKCGGQYMLIDAGDDTKGTTVWNYLRKQGVETLDYLILTHPDKDHIGGAPVVLTKFDVDKVFMSDYEKDNMTYDKLLQTLDDQSIEWTMPYEGDSYSLGDASFTILGPIYDYDNSNDTSIVLVVKHGENSFLFTGDAEVRAEADMLANGIDLEADVYQVGHHGSSSSSSSDFLNAVNPTYAVISCEEGNVYGHPHAEPLNNLRAMGVEVFRTDEQGSIVATSDGKEITWNCAPTNSWQAGERTLSAGMDDDEGDTDESVDSDSKNTDYDGEYILNTNAMKFHLPDCDSVDDISEEHKETSKLSREELIEDGYEACKNCNP